MCIFLNTNYEVIHMENIKIAGVVVLIAAIILSLIPMALSGYYCYLTLTVYEPGYYPVKALVMIAWSGVILLLGLSVFVLLRVFRKK